ncbi:DUF5671 domain-containing protein [Arthrobacter silvisoli]|uniref:DUF5671 domain-containing protein n=1 Tax=Arthrobacter silvisoli TaxID=2291022 RepID=UPI000E21895A|nr:DUF5671 domain-containing protein [Arthrobacter silvisoli]
MSTPATANVARIQPAHPVLRRLILFVLLFSLLLVSASGLTALLERLFGLGTALVSDDVAGLARALAFTLFGAPLTVLLWSIVWRKLDVGAERASVAWGLYVTVVYVVSLLVSTSALLAAATSFIGRPEPQWQSPLSVGLVWAAIWFCHRLMWKHPLKGPLRLADVPGILGSAYGLLLGMFAAAAALGGLFDVAIRGFTSLVPDVDPWWQSVLRSLAWSAGGGLVWWLHWYRGGTRRLRTTLADVVLLGSGIFIPGIAALGGAGISAFVLLRLAFDRNDPQAELLAPLAPAMGAALAGALVWRYHRVAGRRRSLAGRRAAALVTSGIALAAAASGLGVIVNALLAGLVSPLAGDGTRTLLLGGLSSLLVGFPVWWQSWRPLDRPRSVDAAGSARRAYLIVFFGISAAVSIAALLVIGYRLFEFLLGDASGGSLVDRVRAPIGLLAAAGLVAGYHFALWRRERALTPDIPRISHITLVTGEPGGLPRIIAKASGAKVTVWKRADGGSEAPSETGPAAELAERVARALSGVTARHVLLVVGPGTGPETRLEVIPLSEPS